MTKSLACKIAGFYTFGYFLFYKLKNIVFINLIYIFETVTAQKSQKKILIKKFCRNTKSISYILLCLFQTVQMFLNSKSNNDVSDDDIG